VPVVELRRRFGLDVLPTTRKTKWIVLEAAGRLVALVVDSATEVFGTGSTGLRQAPSLGSGDGLRGIAGVVDGPSGMVFVLDEQPIADLVRSLSGRDREGDSNKSLPPSAPRR
jgi:chemotaxis signal transduction protein